MRYKRIFLLFGIFALLLTACNQEDNSDDEKYELLKQDYEALEYEVTSLEENLNELIKREDENKRLISKYEKKIERLNEKHKKEIWELENETFRYKQEATFWEEGINVDFEGEPYLVFKGESIAGVHIGDTFNAVMKKFGNEFEVVFSDDGFEPVVKFDDFSVSVSEGNYCITELYVSSEKYQTSLGVSVGNNAMEVIDKYKKLYKSNEDGSIHSDYSKWIFDLGEDYIIEFWIDTDTLTKDSVITSINLRNLYHGDV
jgi:hypothetical protein